MLRLGLFVAVVAVITLLMLRKLDVDIARSAPIAPMSAADKIQRLARAKETAFKDTNARAVVSSTQEPMSKQPQQYTNTTIQSPPKPTSKQPQYTTIQSPQQYTNTTIQSPQQRQQSQTQQSQSFPLTTQSSLTPLSANIGGCRLPEDKQRQCGQLLASQGPITSRNDFRMWAGRNHPDKGGDEDLFKRVNECVDAECYAKNPQPMLPVDPVLADLFKTGTIKIPGKKQEVKDYSKI